MTLPGTILSVLLATSLLAGAETRVRITGIKGKTEQQVLDLMGERLAHIRREAATPSRADDAAFLVRQILQKDGYTEAQVQWSIANRQEIVLRVNEGRRSSLGEVDVRGEVDAEQAKRFSRLFATPAEKDRPIGLGSAPFREEDVATGLSYIRQDLQANGYWLAQAEEAGRRVDPTSGAVHFTLEVTPGPLHLIGKEQVFSPDGRGVKRVATTVQPFIGRPATTAHLNAMRLAVEEAFISRGYPDAEIRMGRIIRDARFVPDFTIDLGTRVRLNEVHIEGLQRTGKNRINRRFSALEGEWYDEAAMNQRMRQFLATGAFASVRVETEEIEPRLIDATLHFVEARAKEFSLSLGAGSYEGPIVRFTYTDRNFQGKLMGFSTGFEFNARGVLGETRLTEPWLFGTETAATARHYMLLYSHEGYDAFETGLDATITRKFGDHYTMEFLAGWSIANLKSNGLPFADLGETVYTHPRLRFTQILDYRDSPILPKKGWKLQLPLQIGSAIGDDTTSYVKAGLAGGWYHELNRNLLLSLGGHAGMLIPSGNGRELPIDLRYFNGGARSVRSFPERELGPQSNGYAIGGEAYWVANAELVRTLAGPLKAVTFLDAGTISREYSQIGSADIELAIGLGVRLDLPIGPVRLEYGYNLTRDSGEPAGAFHFAIGAAF